MKRLITIFIIVLSYSSFGQDSTSRSIKYTYNGQVIKEKLFKDYLKQLKEVPGTWYCVEMSDGGATGYDCKDKDGKVYTYGCISTSRRNECYLEIQSGGMPQDY